MQALVAVFVFCSSFVWVVFQILSDLFLFLDCVCLLFIKLKFNLHTLVHSNKQLFLQFSDFLSPSTPCSCSCPPSIRPIHSSPLPGFWRIQCNQLRGIPETTQDSVTDSPGFFTSETEEVNDWPCASGIETECLCNYNFGCKCSHSYLFIF